MKKRASNRRILRDRRPAAPPRLRPFFPVNCSCLPSRFPPRRPPLSGLLRRRLRNRRAGRRSTSRPQPTIPPYLHALDRRVLADRATCGLG